MGSLSNNVHCLVAPTTVYKYG